MKEIEIRGQMSEVRKSQKQMNIEHRIKKINIFCHSREGGNPDMTQLYKYAWGNNPKRARMKGRTCKLLASGKMGSVLIEFIDNGQ